MRRDSEKYKVIGKSSEVTSVAGFNEVDMTSESARIDVKPGDVIAFLVPKNKASPILYTDMKARQVSIHLIP